MREDLRELLQIIVELNKENTERQELMASRIGALLRILTEKGILTKQEFDAKVAEMETGRQVDKVFDSERSELEDQIRRLLEEDE